MKVKIKLLNENAKIPTKATEYSAGFDLYACVDGYTHAYPNLTEKIPTGIAIKCPKGYFGAIFARSGLATKKGLRPANCVGVVDEDYTGEIFVPLFNDSRQLHTIRNGDRIAQLVFLPVPKIEFEISEVLEQTQRGAGGFGSTGK